MNAGASSSWFPRPRTTEDLVVLGGPRSKREIFAMLLAPEAKELRSLAGVAGPHDGAARETTRLLEVGGTILKASLACPLADPNAALRQAERAVALQRRAQLWHPEKQWFVLALEGGRGFVVASACPQLVTIRRVEGAPERLSLFGHALAWAAERSKAHGIGLDLNPANFARGPRNQPIYLDDDVYPPLGGREIGEAVAARVPEEPAIGEPEWEGWARSLASRLRSAELSPAELGEVRHGVEAYPLVERFETARNALVSGLRPRREPRARSEEVGQRVCVIADVHGNLRALDAVLEAAARERVDSYLFLGDAVGYGPEPEACVARLASLPRLVAIRGNHDHVVAAGETDATMNRDAERAIRWSREQMSEESRAWLSALPLEARGDGWLAVHGAPRDPARLYAYVYELTFRENLDVIERDGLGLCFYGHTHVAFVHAKRAGGAHERLGAVDLALDDRGVSHLVNPGSVGQPRDGDPRAGFAVWDRARNRIELHRVAYDVGAVVEALASAGLPSDLGARLTIGR